MRKIDSLIKINELMNDPEVLDDPRIFAHLMDLRDEIRAELKGYCDDDDNYYCLGTA